MEYFQNTQSNTEVLAKETLIYPGFYTINIRKFSNIDTLSFQKAFNTAVANLKSDYTKDKYIRDERFNQSWDHIQGEARELIIKLLEMYCAAEYSGFILYKELSYQLKETNSILSDGFSLISRDEARHASFLNKALLDFYIKPGLGFLKKEHRKYISLPFSWFIYSTYLSERISSCYYITIFEHLESHPEYSIYPLFSFYKSWSEDENRHGDFFGAIIKSQLQLSNGLRARLVCKFFLLLIFSMTYFKYKSNDKLLALFGLDAREYYVSTIKKVNNSIRKDLPIVLDVEESRFFNKLDICLLHISENKRINISNQNMLLKLIQKIPHYFTILLVMLRLSIMKSINTRENR
ncbi:magnesium-protoporphyrin IX monomethyl ester (oxidative) cyclase [Nostoc cf. edaphicum LEGE 07299]|uniref:Magnesium-protoporphyrin IX monomethyl ester (oxidative) cyclase n=1 Tax=Nostoc cf. edaphicum LEGE 07299 TaxID=2777974 RepID=A0ABR9U3B8_9NOSO|nr:magnesium-protoporphyrin IX monomethyl ester (oxidative) cyclase [Nostoc edaphicum]MBE9107166.1 magnesium-protoporphyrin IX monomethyl ester (oxidative) cyclase [Nostoc cf. edaphicum LEGE 07299]